MSILMQDNPDTREPQRRGQNQMKNQNKKPKKIKKYMGFLIFVLILGVSSKYGITIMREKSAEKKEVAEVNALMKKQADEEEARKERVTNSKVAYLTFDDGPNKNTEAILNILRENNIKATFFLVGNMIEYKPAVVKKIYEDGHTIGNHTYSHEYNYKTKESFIAEVEKTDAIISDSLGIEYKSHFVRVPGGSMGKKLVQEAIKENGYKSINWTALFGDDEKGGKVNSEYIIDRVKETAGDEQYEVILAHSTKKVTSQSLQSVIDYLKEQGYIFEPLMEDSPIEFS